MFLPNSIFGGAGRNLRCITFFGRGRSSINEEELQIQNGVENVEGGLGRDEELESAKQNLDEE